MNALTFVKNHLNHFIDKIYSSLHIYKKNLQPISNFNLSESTERLNQWKDYSLTHHLQDPEILLPGVILEIDCIEQFSFMKKNLSISLEDFKARTADLQPWTYYVETGDFNNSAFSTFDDKTKIFHTFRNELITKSLLRLFDDDLSQKTIMDIGCNSGFFTLELAFRGALSVTGLDLRKENIIQAQFLKNAFAIENADFLVQNIKNADKTKSYDVVLNLGLMYHLSTPLEVMQYCFEITNDVCVIDTICHHEPFSGFHVITSKSVNSPIEGDLSYELQPTYRGMIETIMAAGFKQVIEVIGVSNNKIDLYHDLTRRCFFAFKTTATKKRLSKLFNNKAQQK